MSGRGDILKVDLTTKKVSREPLSPELRRRFLGGHGINTWLFWEHFLEVDPRIDPLSPDNVLIAGIGPLGATGYGGGTKMKWTFKSPAYGMFGDSICGGNFGAQLRWAGYDHLVITGRADRPVYLWIDDDAVEVRDAAHLWGKDVDEADDLIKEELGDEGLETALVGRAGENLTAFASIIASRHRAAGRTGGGCVMGSKNLKGVAVRGTKGIDIHDPQGFFQAMDAMIAAHDKVPRERDTVKLYGTLRLTSYYQRLGGNAWRNNQYSQLPEESFQRLSHHWFKNNLDQGGLSCSPGCRWGCGGSYRIRGQESPAASRYAGTRGYKPEYVSVASLGIMPDIADMPAVSHLTDMCRRYGMDVTEVGACCGLLMELWQREIISERDTVEWFGEPIALEWGNYEAVERIIESIALHNNPLGEILSGGVYKAAQRLEGLKETPVLKYALYGKGGSPFVEEIRQFPSWATLMAVASRGADHLKAHGTLDKWGREDIAMLYFGRPEAAAPLDITLKGAGLALAENFHSSINNCLGLCLFVVDVDPITFPPEMFAEALWAATGEVWAPEEIRAVGERIANVEKAFNSRLGLRREDDRLCQRWMQETVSQGYGKGWRAGDYLEQTLDEYYEYHGWDKETSLPTRKKLEELGLGDVAGVLERDNALA
jgi:aldehyde:ferredoxin oxidoreductase